MGGRRLAKVSQTDHAHVLSSMSSMAMTSRMSTIGESGTGETDTEVCGQHTVLHSCSKISSGSNRKKRKKGREVMKFVNCKKHQILCIIVACRLL